MGAGVSAGESNDDLVDNLIEGLYIRTLSVEKVFRAVDRGCYFLLDPPVNAYRDVAWKNGNFHISAPCIYSEVMEGLNLAPGLSFLNLGSGTGYLNTMAGLLLGSNGVNHGIELHEDVVEYAVKKVEEFKHHSGALDEFDFCEPKFVQGNCLCVPSGSRVYDRVYCGAGCPPQHLNSIQSFVKIGGVLIVPVNEELLEMKRESETKWTPRVLLPVAFANLVHPTGNAQATVNLLDVEPLSLQELCRSTIRNLLRKNIDIELNTKSGKQKPMKTRSLRSREKNLWQSRQEYFRNIRERNSEDYYDYFLTLRHNEGRQQPPPARDSESSSTNTTHSREGNAESKSSSSDSDDSSSLENKMSSLQEIFMDFMSSPNSESARTSSSSDAQMSSTNDCDNKTESSTMSAKTEASPVEVGKRNNKRNSYNNSGRSGHRSSSNSSGIVASSSEEEVEEERKSKRAARMKERRCNSKWRKIDANNCEQNGAEEDSCDGDSETISNMNHLKMYVSRYSEPMESKIQQLPLPIILKKYLHYYREF